MRNEQHVAIPRAVKPFCVLFLLLTKLAKWKGKIVLLNFRSKYGKLN